jgi:hypothetical protein
MQKEIISCKKLMTVSRLEMEGFSGTYFDLLKLKMEYLLINRDLWVTKSRTKPYSIKDEESRVLESEVRSLIRICLVNLTLLKVCWRFVLG